MPLTPQSADRGLIPRSIDYLFDSLNRDSESSGGKKNFSAKCSFFEIYQERVFDLLVEGSSGALEVREDKKRGVFVDGVMEEKVTSVQQAYAVLQIGRRNRHVGQTDMNRDSSRSHAIFTLTLQMAQETASLAQEVRTSRFSFVDLAGSERQRDTHASGERLREAGGINKSLSTLGNVISSLTRAQGQGRGHICYRDSKLTFLLRDALGGNTKVRLNIL